MKTSLVILAFALTLAASQMTFSDGWEKRQSSRPYEKHYAHKKVARSVGHASDTVSQASGADATRHGEQPKHAPITEITPCMEEYMAGLRELHVAMMDLYSRFETCENAVVNPLLAGSQEKTPKTRF